MPSALTNENDLPFAPFEHYMLADDRVDLPMCFYVRLSFQGCFDKPALQNSFAQAVSRHPLLHSVHVGSADDRTSRLRWRPANTRAPKVRWLDRHDDMHQAHRPHIDLTAETGIRLYAIRDDRADETLLVVQAHHSCTDAIGAVQFLDDLLACYHQHAGSESGQQFLSPLNRDLLAERTNLGMREWHWWKRATHDVCRILGFFRGRIEPITKSSFDHQRHQHDDTTLPISKRIELDTKTLQQLKDCSRKYEVTINDLLLRDLFLTIKKWKNTDARQNQNIRVGMPVNLRSTRHTHMPAANLVSMTFLCRKIAACTDKHALLRDVHQETRYIKRHKIGLTLWRVVSLCGLFSGGVRCLLGKRQCFATTILSNLGEPFRCSLLPRSGNKIMVGGLELRSVDLLPPIRSGTDAVFGVTTYNNCMSITLRYNHRAFSEAEAWRLLTLFQREITANLTAVSSSERTRRAQLAELHCQSNTLVENTHADGAVRPRTAAKH